MVFQKGREKTGGRKKGTSNKATQDLKQLVDRMLPEAELERIWKKKLYSKDPEIAMKAFELALHYRFGKPMTIVAGPEEHPPIKIDISAIPKHHVKA
jgi:hypothetical protein